MNKLKKLIIATLILLLILIFILIIIIRNKNEMKKGEIVGSEGMPEDIYIINPKIELVKSRNDFYIVKRNIEKYYTYLTELNNPQAKLEGRGGVNEPGSDEYIKYIIEEDTDIIYNILNTDYINDFGITKNNLLDKLGNHKGKKLVLIDKMYVMEKSTDISIYFVYGMLSDEETKKTSDFTLMVILDKVNNTFNIAPFEYMEKKGYHKLSEGTEIQIETQRIENKQYNTYEYKNILDEIVILDYINLYKAKAINKVKESYILLNEEYRDNRFGNIEEYEKYVKDNINNIKNINIYKYSSEGIESNKTYIAIDHNGKYYIITETDIMQYSIILDTYTVDIPEFIEKYNSTNAQGKVALNIQKFTDSLNNKDYKYAYSRLSDEFKNNNFVTLQSFQEYIEKNIYENSQIEYIEYKQEGNIYTYKINFRNIDNESQSVEKTIIMKLEDNGTNFELSFNK